MPPNTTRRRFLHTSLLTTSALALGLPFTGFSKSCQSYKTDISSFFSAGKKVKITGQVFDLNGNKRINQTLKIWHYTDKLMQKRKLGHLKTDNLGQYSLISDFPGNVAGKMARIYFELKGQRPTELLISNYGAHITGKHWEKNRHLGEKLFPTYISKDREQQINFNFSV